MEPSSAAATEPDQTGYQIDDLIVDIGQQRVTRSGTEIPLPRLSFELLVTLAQAAPNLVSFDQLTERVWPGLVITPETISQRVKLVRTALGDDRHAPRYIGGVRSRGYRMVASVRPLAERRQAAEPVTPYWVDAPPREGAPDGGATRPTTQSALLAQRPIPENSIAVLPFVDMSARKDQAYFSDGLAEALIDLLTQVKDLRVPARTSSFSFKDESQEIATIAHKLRVAHVLEGSVRKAGNTIRVTAHLIRAENGYHLWSKTYDREFKDIFKIQDEIAAVVVEALKAQLLPTQRVVNRGRTASTEAYDQYLRGKQLYNRGNVDDYRRAVAAYEQAVARDPRYAAAWAGLALAESYAADYAETLSENACGKRRAVAAAEQAIALEPDLADGYVARGFLRQTSTWDRAGALADLERAQVLNPGAADVQVHYAEQLASLGRLADAIEATQKALELDPLSSRAWLKLGWFGMGTYPDSPAQLANAHQALTRAIEISPEATVLDYYLGIAKLLGGDARGALATFKKAGQVWRLTGTAMAQHTLGHAQASQQALDEAINGYAHIAAYQIAEACGWRDQKDDAFDWLARAYAQIDGGLIYVKYDPLLLSLRDDPRYKALLGKMNLPVSVSS